LDLSADPGRLRLPDGNLDLERELCRALRRHRVGGPAHELRDRALRDELEKVGGLVLGLQIDQNANVAVEEVRNARANAARLHPQYRAPGGRDLHTQALENEIARQTARLRPALRKAEIGLVDLRDDLEDPLGGVCERELRQRALEPEPHVVRGPSPDRRLEVVHDGRGELGNVAIHRAAVDAREISREIDEAGRVLSPREVAVERSDYVGVAERKVVESDLEAVRGPLPADLSGEPVELRPAFREDPGKLERHPLRPEHDAAAALARLEPPGEPGHSG